MFETIIVPQYSQEEAGQGMLRLLQWPEIVARLAATRDLRELFARPAHDGGAFALATATGIASRPASERSVNYPALIDCKWVGGTTAPATSPMDHGDRDKR